MPGPHEHPPMRWWTIPNAVSLARLIIFVPLTLALLRPGSELAATIALALFGATDWIDGALARVLKQVSRVGELLDPIADRLGVLIIGAAATVAGYLPWRCIAVIGGCDLVLGGIGLARMHRVREGRVTWIGKIRTALLMIAMPLHIVSFAPEVSSKTLRTAALCLLVLGTLLHAVAAFGYAKRYLSASPEHSTRTDGMKSARVPSRSR